MAIRNREPQHANPEVNRLRRKRDQAWELAGCARQDGDRIDEERYTQEAMECTRQIGRLLRGEE